VRVLVSKANLLSQSENIKVCDSIHRFVSSSPPDDLICKYFYLPGPLPTTKTEEIDENYNFPVIALKALSDYQPREYQFDLESRELFDISKLPKDVRILNGDISEEVAKSQAKTLVEQLQSQKTHEKFHMIQSIHTDSDVGDVELLHAPVWFAKYDHKGNKIVLVIDANSGQVISSLGL
jgi:hypothetical protein